jgi:hypothetical protein
LPMKCLGPGQKDQNLEVTISPILVGVWTLQPARSWPV